VVAGLQAHHGGTASGALASSAQRVNLGMRLAGSLEEALAYHHILSIEDDAAHDRVRAVRPQSTLRELDRSSHGGELGLAGH
jgi:hypothetical protein